MSSSGRSKWNSATRTELILVLRSSESCCPIESVLDGLFFRNDRQCPAHRHARKRLGNEKAVPGTESPGAAGVQIDGADGGSYQGCELGYARLGSLGRAARTIGSDGNVVLLFVSSLEITKAYGSIA